MRVFPVLAGVLALMILGGCQPSESQSIEEPLAPDRIVQNLKLQIPQLRQAQTLNLSPPQSSTVEGFRKATLTINGANQMPVLISEDGAQLLVLASEPVDVSRSAEEVTAALDKEQQANAERFAAMEERLPAVGPAEAPVTVTIFSDFQCPYCARALPLVNQIKRQYPERVRMIFAHFPLPMHGWARPASIAAQCAARQNHDAFWTLHDAYFEQQGSITEANVLDKAESFLADANLDMNRWRTCATDTDSEAHQEAATTVDETMTAGESMQVRGTPTFFINGDIMRGPRTFEAFQQRIEAEASP